MPKATRIIQIGVGGFGKHWVEAIGSTRRVKIAGLVDPNSDALAEAAEKLSIPQDRCLDKLDAAMGLDFEAAIICTPPATRPAIYRKLAKAGKHILAEKPLSGDMRQARAAVALKKQTGIRFAIAQNYRYRPCIRAAKRAIDSGKFGRPRY